MTTCCNARFVKCLILTVLLGQVFSAPKSVKNGDSIKEIFSETKRQLPMEEVATVPLLKSPLFNPYFMYPPMFPGRPFFYPITPSDILLNRLVKSVAGTSTSPKITSLNSSDPALMSAYFKAKKDEFLTKLLEKLTTDSAGTDKMPRSVEPTENTSEATKIDSSFFIKKKYEFLDTLFKALNVTPSPPSNDSIDETTTAAPSTPKPTIVPPDFWFPFAKLPKPTKAPKPTKPPKAKKILKDALDTILLQSLLIDMGVDPKDASLNKRASAIAGLAQKTKSKKTKAEDLTDFETPGKADPALYSAKASYCLNKLFKMLNKTEDNDSESFFESKPTAMPANTWAEPSETEYSKLDAFLDLLIKSLNATDYPTKKSESISKPAKPLKSKSGKKIKRSTFLDELLHRATTSPVTTTTEPTMPTEQDITIPYDPECDFAQILKDCCCSKCLEGASEKSGKSSRSLIFKPFGSGYWIPQYLYAAKMGMYLDKLMDTINTAAATEMESESSRIVKRSIDSADSDYMSDSPSKDTAINLIIAELTELKNNLVDAFTEGIKAQKDGTPAQKPFGSSKSFKKPFWGPKMFATTDPVAPIQKRIDILNDIFDNLTKVEKTLIFTAEPEYNPKLLTNLTEILELNTKKMKTDKSNLQPKPTPTNPSPEYPEYPDSSNPISSNPDTPEYLVSKIKEYLKSLYESKDSESDDK